MAERFNTMQGIQDWWESRVIPDDARTPLSRIERWVEELYEVGEAGQEWMENDTYESRRELAGEVVDTIIIALGIIGSLGFDAENLILEKMESNHHKYNIVENQKLQENGMSWQEALSYQKDQFNAQTSQE